MFCRTIEKFTTNTNTIDDVASQGEKNIMLTDADGNISLVKFSDTVIRLQGMINDLNKKLGENTKKLGEIAKMAEDAIKHDDKINIIEAANGVFFLNSCGVDDAAPCVGTQGGTALYVSAYTNGTSEGNDWRIKKKLK